MDDKTTETHDIPGGTETKSESHSETPDGEKTEISENVTEDTVKGEEANEI